MRIAIWSDTFPPQVNGVASVTRDLAAALTDLGHEIAVFTVVDKSRIKKDCDGKTYAIHKIPSFSMPKFIYPGEGLSVAVMPGPRTIRALKKFDPDIIHAHTPFLAGWSAVLGKKILNIPLVGTHHTFFDDYLKHVNMDYPWGRAFSWKYTVVYYNRADAVTSPSRALGAALTDHGLTSPVHIIPNPADTEFFIPVSSAAHKNRVKKKFGSGKRAIVYMGRVSYEKNIDQAVKAFSIALRDMPDATFMIVGDGPERKKLEGMARTLGCAGKIIFTGMLHGEELRDALWANDLFLTASQSENMPISIIEAMACGLPVVAVRARGIPDIVHHGENGLLAPPGQADLLARALVEIFSSPDDLQEKGIRSRKLAEHYSKKNIARAMIELYEEVIKSHSLKKTLTL